MTTATRIRRKLLDFAVQELDFSTRLYDAYYYAHPGLAILDAVFSINARYNSTVWVPRRYAGHFGLAVHRSPKLLEPPSAADQESLWVFLSRISSVDTETLAASILKNRQRTSTKNGILKADAALRWARILCEHGIEYFQDLSHVGLDDDISRAIATVPGHKTLVAWRYFLMLCGNAALIKPDRMVKLFLAEALQCREAEITNDTAQELLTGLCADLRPSHPDLSPRLLDHTIWNRQRRLALT